MGNLAKIPLVGITQGLMGINPIKTEVQGYVWIDADYIELIEPSVNDSVFITMNSGRTIRTSKDGESIIKKVKGTIKKGE